MSRQFLQFGPAILVGCLWQAACPAQATHRSAESIRGEIRAVTDDLDEPGNRQFNTQRLANLKRALAELEGRTHQPSPQLDGKAQEIKAQANSSADATNEDSFRKLWTFGWFHDLLPVRTELVAELRLNDLQKVQIERIVEDYRTRPNRDSTEIQRLQRQIANQDETFHGWRQELAMRKAKLAKLEGEPQSTKTRLDRIWTEEQQLILARLKASSAHIGPRQQASVDSFLTSWSLGWRAGLLPVPAERVGELGLSDSQKLEIQAILSRARTKTVVTLPHSDIARPKSIGSPPDVEEVINARRLREGLTEELADVSAWAKTKLMQVWTEEQKAILARHEPVDR